MKNFSTAWYQLLGDSLDLDSTEDQEEQSYLLFEPGRIKTQKLSALPKNELDNFSLVTQLMISPLFFINEDTHIHLKIRNATTEELVMSDLVPHFEEVLAWYDNNKLFQIHLRGCLKSFSRSNFMPTASP
jgi:hypothetical protein